MRILVVGSGAREHALVWKLGREPGVTAVVCAPGNAGTSQHALNRPVDVSDPEAILALAAAEAVDLTVVGPELPLARGVQDLFAARGRSLFGPSRTAAQLESSKAFAKAFMTSHGVPTARFQVCDSPDAALAAVSGAEFGFPVVVKADGLAAGKGVTVAPDRETAWQAVRDAMIAGRFGAAGRRVVIEECLTGPEASFFTICDGRQALALPAAQDHKRAFDGDRGPNTGGMGAFAPSPLVTPDLEARIQREIVQPVLEGLAAQGHPYRGFLYVGLMLTAEGPKVIEFNVRLGDPEAQVVLPMLTGELAPVLAAAARGEMAAPSQAAAASGEMAAPSLAAAASGEMAAPSLAAAASGEMAAPSLTAAASGKLAAPSLTAAASGELAAPSLACSPDPHVGVVLASGGYPGAITTGEPIMGLDAAAALDGVLLFHAGTGLRDGAVVTTGGRVLTAVGRGGDMATAIDRAYAAEACISFARKQVRTDIGRTALAGEVGPAAPLRG